MKKDPKTSQKNPVINEKFLQNQHLSSQGGYITFL